MESLNEHYKKLLGINHPWEIDRVRLNMKNRSVDILLKFQKGTRITCPECGDICTIKDHNRERTWRHLDTMQFTANIHARVPRADCPAHGAKTIAIPWSNSYSRYTLLFEKFAIKVLQACKNISDARDLLRLSWDEVHRIQKMAVERGLKRREEINIKYAGVDEKSFRKGHKYVSILTDLENNRVLDVNPGRTKESVEKLISNLSKEEQKNIKAVSIDMSPTYTAAIEELLPKADIVYDKFHVVQKVSEAMAKIWRNENNDLKSNNDNSLKDTKFIWLKNHDKLTEKQKEIFNSFRVDLYKIGKAWLLKEAFKEFWDYKYGAYASKYFNWWYYWATHSRIKQMIAVAKTIKKHMKYILTYFKHRISNAATEGMNSRIQTVKANARGFKNIDNFRIAILFYCGKLDLYP